MAFNPTAFIIASTITRDMEDRARAAQISLLGGMLGRNLGGTVLLAAAASEGRLAGPATLTPTTGAGAPSRVEVPDLPRDHEEAAQVIKSRGLVPVTVAVVSDDPIDCVIGSEPPADTVVRQGSTVEILVSAGIQVPKVTGKEIDEAVSILESAGFEAEPRKSERPGKEGVVERQEPEAGAFESAGSTVTLYVFEPRRKGALKPAPAAEAAVDE